MVQNTIQNPSMDRSAQQGGRFRKLRLHNGVRFINIDWMETLTASKKKFEAAYRQVVGEERTEISLHSEGRQDLEVEGNEKLFSFNQSFTGQEQTDKNLLERSNSLSRVRQLEDELRGYKQRAGLWDKTRAQILICNSTLKLSSVSLGCSDSAIMKEFFEVVAGLLGEREGKNQQQRSKVVDNKKREAELFQKLVQSNKKKYELQQKIVKYEHQLTKMQQINDSLRERSRAMSTERSSKIHNLNEQTLITIQQKDLELSTLEQRNMELKMVVQKYEEECGQLQMQLGLVQRELAGLKYQYEELDLEHEIVKKEMARKKEEELETEEQIDAIREEMVRIVEENIDIRQQLKKRSDYIFTLRNVIETARLANQQYRQELANRHSQEEADRNENIAMLLLREEQLKNNLNRTSKYSYTRKTTKKITKATETLPQSCPPRDQLLI